MILMASSSYILSPASCHVFSASQSNFTHSSPCVPTSHPLISTSASTSGIHTSTCGNLERIWSSSPKRTSKGNGPNCASRGESSTKPEQAEKTPVYISSEESTLEPKVQSHLDLLERFTSDTNSSAAGKTIAQQLEGQLDAENVEEITVPLAGKKPDAAPPLTISQKRNIRRQNYLNEVAKRNDAPFFTRVLILILLPPSAILGVAIATGYIDLFP